MNLNELLNQLSKFPKPEGRLKLIFVNKNGIKYKAYEPSVSNKVQEKLMKLFVSNIKDKIDAGLEKVDFNPSGHGPEQYSVCDKDYVGNFKEVKSLFKNTQTEELKPDQVSFFVFRLRINNDGEKIKYIYLFRKNYKMKNLRKGLWMSKVEDTYQVLKEDLIGIDGGIDAVAYKKNLAFFTHISAERIFNLREKFAENAEIVLNKISAKNTIDNFEAFKEDCLEDARILRRLTKIHSNPEIINLYHAHFDNAPEVVELFDLNITFSKDNSSIVYTSKEQLKDITMLMRDAYYRTVLANRKGIDDFN